jgi:hypothetical protein
MDEPVQGDPTTPPHMGVLQVPGAKTAAPLAPEQDLDPARLPYMLDCSVKDFVLRRLRAAEKDGELEEDLRARVILNNFLMWRGQHTQYAAADGSIAQLLDESDDDSQMFNWYAMQVEGKAKEWEASKPRIEIAGRTRDYRLEGAARLAEALDKFVRKDQITAHFRQSEAKFGMLAKFYVRYSFPDADESDDAATRVQVPVTERRRFHVGAVMSCPNCDHAWGEPDNMEGTPVAQGEAAAQEPDLPEPVPCPECSHPEAEEMLPRHAYERDVETGETREHVVPRLRHASLNPLNVKIDYRARTFADSYYCIVETLERRFDVEGMYEGQDLSKLPSVGGDLSVRMRAALALERTTAGVASPVFEDAPVAETREDELVRCRRFWLLPRAYRHYRAREDEVFCGVEIKRGERLGDHFPSGWLNVVYGDREILETADESKNRRLTGAPFTLDPTTMHGKGTEDLNGIQLTIDDMATLAVSHFDREGAPKEVIDTRLVDPDELDGDTGKRIVMKDTAPEGTTAAQAIHVVQSGELGSDFGNFFQQLPNIMREVGGVSNPIVGVDDQHNPTARGRELAAQQSSSMLIPSLALRAEMVETETTYQNLEYCQEHWADEDFTLFESEHGAEAIETFRNLNVRRDLVATAAPGSWIPETREAELANCEEFGTKYLLPAAQGGLPLSFVKYAARLYNVPADAFEPEAAVRVAQARLARLRKWADTAMQSGATELSPPAYEMMIQTVLAEADMQPRPFENHEVEKDFLAQQWMSLFDDRKANPVLMDLIEGLIGNHDNAVMEAQARQGLPAVAAEAEARGSDEASKESDHARAQEAADADAKRQVKVEKVKASGRKGPGKK